MCLSPKLGEEKKHFLNQKKTNIPKNYSKKQITKLCSTKNPFSRNFDNKQNKNNNLKSSQRILSNHVSTNTTSNNSSFKNISKINIHKSFVYNHKKSESYINILSFMNQNLNPNIYNQKQEYNNIINENYKMNNSFFNDMNNKEKKSKEIFINKIAIKKLTKKNRQKNEKKNGKNMLLKKNKKYLKDNSNNTALSNTCKSKAKNNIVNIGNKKKLIINLSNTPKNQIILNNNKTHYYSKKISPSGSKNFLLKSSNNAGKDNNSIIKTYFKKMRKEKLNKESFNKIINNSKNKKCKGNMFAIHKILENNLFCNKMDEKTKNNLNKKEDKKNLIEGICFGHTMNHMNHSYGNNNKFKHKKNLSNNSINFPSKLIFFNSTQNNSDKNCLYKNNKYNESLKQCFSSNNIENNNKTYNFKINDKKNDLINIYNINSINKFDNSLFLKIENNFENKEKDKRNSNNNKSCNKDKGINIKENNKIKLDKNEMSYQNQKDLNKLIEKSKYYLIEKEDNSPEETHFQVITFIQYIKTENNNYL